MSFLGVIACSVNECDQTWNMRMSDFAMIYNITIDRLVQYCSLCSRASGDYNRKALAVQNIFHSIYIAFLQILRRNWCVNNGDYWIISLKWKSQLLSHFSINAKKRLLNLSCLLTGSRCIYYLRIFEWRRCVKCDEAKLDRTEMLQFHKFLTQWIGHIPDCIYVFSRQKQSQDWGIRWYFRRISWIAGFTAWLEIKLFANDKPTRLDITLQKKIQAHFC